MTHFYNVVKELIITINKIIKTTLKCLLFKCYHHAKQKVIHNAMKISQYTIKIQCHVLIIFYNVSSFVDLEIMSLWLLKKDSHQTESTTSKYSYVFLMNFLISSRHSYIFNLPRMLQGRYYNYWKYLKKYFLELFIALIIFSIRKYTTHWCTLGYWLTNIKVHYITSNMQTQIQICHLLLPRKEERWNKSEKTSN